MKWFNKIMAWIIGLDPLPEDNYALYKEYVRIKQLIPTATLDSLGPIITDINIMIPKSKPIYETGLIHELHELVRQRHVAIAAQTEKLDENH